MKYTYPNAPVSVPANLLIPSTAFRRNAWKVFASILFFILFYLSLITATVFLALGCWYIGLAILMAWVSFISIILALSVWGMGLLLIFFVFKFVFSFNKNDYSNTVEITEEEEPELFNFIKRVAEETVTPLPNRVFISPDVNASVSFNSSFWSLFLPVRKNLTIGLGLVNSVNLSEFKAIIAHEFGHFSQRSMKLGSYIYHVNHIIYNMLFDNSGYSKLLDRWAELHGAFAFMASITVWFLQLIQKALIFAYGIINRAYSGLSKQMEFHADAVAASVAGSNHLAPSLYRMAAAEICYQRLLSHYDDWIKQQYKPANMYTQHTCLMHYFAKDFNADIEHGLLQVSEETLTRFSTSDISIKDQWASHPSTQEREAALQTINLPTTICHESPWILFKNAEQLQQKVTAVLFKAIDYPQPPLPLTDEIFVQGLEAEREKYQLSEVLKGFYDGRAISAFPADQVPPANNEANLEELLSSEILALPTLLNTNAGDQLVLKQIDDADGGIKTFDYKGVKYSHKDTVTVKILLDKANETLTHELEKADERLYAHALGKASKAEQAELMLRFKTYFKAMEAIKTEETLLNQMQVNLNQVYTETMQIDIALAWQSGLKKIEATFKASLSVLLSHKEVSGFITPLQQNIVDKYMEKDLIYFVKDRFDYHALKLFSEVLNVYVQLLTDYLFELKKQALNYQAELLQR